MVPRIGLPLALTIGLAACLTHFPTAGLAQTASMQKLARDLWPQASKRGISRKVYDSAFAGLTPDKGVLEDAANQAEFKMSVGEYLAKRVSETRIGNGRAMAARHAVRIAAIERRYGVDRHVLVSIWGLESNYGEKRGEYGVVRALATLALTKRRARFGRSQLLAALKILQKGDVPLSDFNGSWAGAMGHTQFIPTTYNAYAVDWTGDGKRDIWNSVSDALASTANYLAKSGWKSSLPWGWRVELPAGFNHRLAGSRRTVGAWEKAGLSPAAGARVAGPDTSVTLLLPTGKKGPAYLVTRNFRAILAYNNAVSYALSVGLLADRIRSDRASHHLKLKSGLAALEPAEVGQ